jgi:hypothetical protein
VVVFCIPTDMPQVLCFPAARLGVMMSMRRYVGRAAHNRISGALCVKSYLSRVYLPSFPEREHNNLTQSRSQEFGAFILQ